MLYRTIVADPPWPYACDGKSNGLGATKEHRPNSWDGVSAGPGSKARYGSMSIEDLCVMSVPSDKNAHLYLWTTNAFMVEAHQIARAWGFKPKTILTWVKMKANGTPSMKTGYWYRSATEHVLFAVRGSLRLTDKACVPTAFLGPRLAHSVKPDSFFQTVERVSPGPYLEMFARKRRPGWDAFGNQVEGSIALAALKVSPDRKGKE